MSAPKITAIITTYNAESYISETLERISEQTLAEIQVIFIDDASDDNTADIIRNKCDSDTRFKLLINDDNHGAGYSRNRGMEFAQGEYVIFLDDDDIYSYEMLERSYNQAKDTGSDIVVFRSNTLDDNNGKITDADWTISRGSLPDTQTFTVSDVRNNFFRSFIWWAWDKLISRDLIIRSGLHFQEIRTSNDLYFVCAIMLQADAISVCDEVLITHKDNRQGSLSNTREQSYQCSLEAIEKLNGFILSSEEYASLRQNYLNYSVDFLSWSLSTLKDWQAYSHFYLLLQAYFRQYAIAERSEFETTYLADTYEALISSRPEVMLMDLKCRLENDIRHLTQANRESQHQISELTTANQQLHFNHEAYETGHQHLQSQHDSLQNECQALAHQVQILTGKKNEMTAALEAQIEQKTALENTLHTSLEANQRLTVKVEEYQHELQRLRNSLWGKLYQLFSGGNNKN
ncbi:glycosyltransferase family 2 protein [Tatumella saanichensis]|uniref:glycosyltransferase family 2 protein n=1 Tax=Tatumella saanichensis TaxID=480813 RepID=UPI0004B513C4|nr:glycosyltransferase family 2 protein [Tatumella saanichensis]